MANYPCYPFLSGALAELEIGYFFEDNSGTFNLNSQCKHMF